MAALLQNHIAAVTGAGSGIGRAIAIGFAREGAQVAVLDINGEAATGTAAEIRNAGGKAESFTLDVTDHAACRAIAAQVGEKVGTVSILVNNAGINRRNAFVADADAVLKDWQDITAINLDGVFNVTHAFLSQLRANKGRIIDIGSIQSFVHVRTPHSVADATSKHGVSVLPRAPGRARQGRRPCQCGRPRAFERRSSAGARRRSRPGQDFIDHTPLGRPGQPDDVVGPAHLSRLDLSAFVTGTIIMADSGYRTI